MIQILTDYPFRELGDEPGKIAPQRILEAHFYDGDKYVGIVLPDGQRTSIKAGYCYKIEAEKRPKGFFSVHPGTRNLPIANNWEDFDHVA